MQDKTPGKEVVEKAKLAQGGNTQTSEGLIKNEKLVERSETNIEDTTLGMPPIEPLKKPNKLRNMLFVGAIVLVAAALVLTGSRKQESTSAPVASDKAAVDLARYSVDTDGDRLADFIESRIGYDPYVSELDRCFNSKCDSVDTETIKAIPRNVMILLDSSGSMQQQVGDHTKMESAKIAIREYLKKTGELESTSVGLIVYGHKGTNSAADKGLSCQSAEIKVPLGELTLASADKPLVEINPAGWTPIGLALKEAAKSFAVKPSSKKSPAPTDTGKVINEVVIISDGVETCDTSPSSVAQELYASSDQVVVHVIGFAVDSTADNQALREISQAAGGTYATAPTIDELKLAMDLQWDSYVRRAREDACRVRGYENFLACRDETIAKVNAYISSELSRDPRVLPHEEKLKIDRIRYVYPAYMSGTLDPLLLSATPAPTASDSPAPSPSPSP